MNKNEKLLIKAESWTTENPFASVPKSVVCSIKFVSILLGPIFNILLILVGSICLYNTGMRFLPVLDHWNNSFSISFYYYRLISELTSLDSV